MNDFETFMGIEDLHGCLKDFYPSNIDLDKRPDKRSYELINTWGNPFKKMTH